MGKLFLLASLVLAAFAGAARAAAEPSLAVPAGYTAEPLAVDGQVERFSLGFTLGFDAAGNLLVGTISAANVGGSCAPNGGALYRVNPDGTSTELAGTSSGLMAPSGIAAGPGGVWGTESYVADSNAGTGDCSGRVFRVEPDGTLTTISNHSIPPLGDEPRGLAFGGGALWIVEATTWPNVFSQPDSGQIERVGAPGEFPQIVAQGFPLGDPSSIAFGPGGAYGSDLYIADLGEQAAGGPPPAILRMDASGNVSVFADASRSPDGQFTPARLAFAPPGPFGGLLYAPDNVAGATGVRRVVSVDPSGAITPFATLVGNNANEYLNNAVVSPDGQTMYVMMLDYSFLNTTGQTAGTTIIWRVTRDTTPPAISCGSADGAWHADNVSIECTASDSGSGLADPADASFSLSTSVPAGSETADASTDSRQVCDVAGNCATAGPIGGNMIDRAAPTLHLPADITTSDPVVTYTATASDGTDPAPSVSCAPASGSTFPVGTTTVGCTATDHAGNTATGSFTVTVAVVDPLVRLTQDADLLGRANLKAHVRNLAQVGGNGYCAQLKVIEKELRAITPPDATVLDAEDAVAALQEAHGC